MKTKNFSLIKGAEAAAIAFITVIYAIYCYTLFSKAAINSDFANLVLEANDILRGNVFLNGWSLTGISFFTTDLLYFVLGAVFGGVSILSYEIAITLMFVAMAMAGMQLIKSGGQKLSAYDILLFMAIGGVPVSALACDLLRAHTGVIVYLFIMMLCLEKLLAHEKAPKKRWQVLYALCIALGVMGDAIMLVLGVAPVILVLGFRLMASHKVDTKAYSRLLLLTAAAAILGLLGDRLYFLIGGANKNSYLDLRIFMPYSEIPKKFDIYLHALFGLFNADFTGAPLMSALTVWFAFRISMIIFGIFTLFSNLIKFLKGQEADVISAMLGIGFVLISALFMLTDISVDINSARYFAYAPVLFAILIIRYCKRQKLFDARLFYKKLSSKILIGALAAAFLGVALVQTEPSFDRASKPQERLGAFLQAQGLTNGYAGFWNASETTVSANNGAAVRAITCDGQAIGRFDWFCKAQWYEQYANFVVMENEQGATFNYANIREETIYAALGEPARRLEFENYIVYTYERDISKELLW